MTDPHRPGTFAHDDDLPRLPLPALRDSAQRFLRWCEPLLDSAQFTATETAVEEFLSPESPAWALHSELERVDASQDSQTWLDDYWPSQYLGARGRVALDVNYFFLLTDREGDQCERAADLLAAAVDFKRRVDAEEVPPEAPRGRPQSMEQLKRLFGTTRIPGEMMDTVRTPYSPEHPGPSRARHIIVFTHGHMFSFDVLDPDGRPHTPDELTTGLRELLATVSEQTAPGQSVGHLTTKDRTKWARSRYALLEIDSANLVALETVETALLCLTLEGDTPTDDRAAAARLLHGDSANRWFDKVLGFVVFPNGRAGLNCEHSTLDGTTAASFLNAIDAFSAPERTGTDSGRVPGFAPVEFVLDEALRADIRESGEAFADYAAQGVNATFSSRDFNSERAKALGVSPDAFIQLAFQLAHQRAKGRPGATYESISSRQYHYGRTESMRVITPESVAFVEAMEDPDADAGTREAAARAAAREHSARAKGCQVGEGPERHLWTLELIRRDRGAALGAETPMALYDSPGWRIMRSDHLSTSSVPCRSVNLWGFGSTGPDCIGIGYILLPERIDLHLHAPRSLAEVQERFVQELGGAFEELAGLLADESTMSTARN
ncbi:choline/carnitine O-acyltransferase [Nocardiopsis sp. NPDC006832]|uniref:choline/carnitine O-acyltransferase n=1 Tax=Nocardiopsis sp. NPDC006832 TaxID=3157188 RepID=UPI0033D7C675